MGYGSAEVYHVAMFHTWLPECKEDCSTRCQIMLKPIITAGKTLLFSLLPAEVLDVAIYRPRLKKNSQDITSAVVYNNHLFTKYTSHVPSFPGHMGAEKVSWE